jgi:dolichol-phosphate mannosyltransferase
MIYILLPVFNESKNIAGLHKELTECFSQHEVFYVFSDDGSTDNSVEIIKDEFVKNNHIILGDGTNHGPGFAFNTGFEWILSHSKDPQADKIISLEADCTSDLSIAPQMIEISDIGYDLVLASVYAQGGELQNTTLFRKILSFFANMILRFKFDLKVLTLSSFYRLYTVSSIRKIKDKYGVIINQNGFISMIEILLKAIHIKAHIIEIPVRLLSEKRQGSSKMKILKTFTSYVKFLSTTNIK